MNGWHFKLNLKKKKKSNMKHYLRPQNTNFSPTTKVKHQGLQYLFYYSGFVI